MTTTRHIYLLSPYHTGSHKSWANGLIRHSRHKITLLSMAGRFWKWRMQGGAIELATATQAKLASGTAPPDAILATDMVNLPTYLGLVRHHLPADLPVLLYMHENQLTYPWRPGEKPDLTYAMINWQSMIGADRVIFNTHYHLESWFGEVTKLLKHYPDYNHLSLVEQVREKSMVLPVGIASPGFAAGSGGASLSTRGEGGRAEEPSAVTGIPSPLVERDSFKQNAKQGEASPPLILWNQRWEYDKRPDLFFDLLYRLRDEGIDFRLAVAGENFRKIPEEFEEAQERLADQIVHWGYVEAYADYVALLSEADLVISTAIHEFFGISVLEAIAAGAFPLLPNRLSYPELIPRQLHPACLYEDQEALFRLAKQRLYDPRPAPPSLQNYVLDHFQWPRVAGAYDQLFEDITVKDKVTR